MEKWGLQYGDSHTDKYQKGNQQVKSAEGLKKIPLKDLWTRNFLKEYLSAKNIRAEIASNEL